jgi:hypothetical protein
MAGNLRRAAEFVEMNLSQMGKDERRTRIGYKDQVRQGFRPDTTDFFVYSISLHGMVLPTANR